MSAHPVDPKVVWETLRLLVKYGDSVATAKATGLAASTIRERAAKAKALWPSLFKDCPERGPPGWANSLKLPKEMPLPDSEVKAQHLTEEGLRQRRQDEQASELRDQISRLQQRVLALQDQNDSLLGMKAKKLEGVKWVEGTSSGKKTELIPVLFTSDFQCGEVIRANEIDGINAYDKDIFASRYNRLIEATIDISAHHTGPAEYPGIFYLRGGDAISGDIHEELRDTNDLSAIPAGQWLLRQEREGIKRLRAKFGRVMVVSIPGNHGRNTLKPRSKSYVQKNYETMLTWWLQTMFEDDPRVTFLTPESGDAWFEVLGWNFLLAHGDRMGSRGGTGHIGPAATIARGHFRLFKNWSVTGKIPDVILTGHLHTSLKLEMGYANGSLPGFNEYARDLGFTPAAPMQWLLYVHQRHGVSHAFEVKLDSVPRRRIDKILARGE